MMLHTPVRHRPGSRGRSYGAAGHHHSRLRLKTARNRLPGPLLAWHP